MRKLLAAIALFLIATLPALAQTVPLGPRFVLPYQTVIDGTGVPIPGALLNFYASGTSTRLTTYSDALLTVPNANPVAANAAGVFPNIFLNGNYKVILTDSLNNQIWTADPVDGGAAQAGTVIGPIVSVIGCAVQWANTTGTFLGNQQTLCFPGNISTFNAASGNATANFTYGTITTPLPNNASAGYTAINGLQYVQSTSSGIDPTTAMFVGTTHMVSGTYGVGLGVLGRSYCDTGWTPVDSTAGCYGLQGIGNTSVAGAVGGANFGANALTTAGANMTTVESDSNATVNVANKYGFAAVDLNTSVGSVTGKLTIGGSGCSGNCVIPNDAAFYVLTAGGANSPYGWDYGLLAVQVSSGGRPPITSTGSLIRAGGYALANIIDIPDVTCTNFLNLPALKMTCAGLVTSSETDATDGTNGLIRLIPGSTNFLESVNSGNTGSVNLTIAGHNAGAMSSLSLVATTVTLSAGLTVSGLTTAGYVTTTSGGTLGSSAFGTGVAAALGNAVNGSGGLAPVGSPTFTGTPAGPNFTATAAAPTVSALQVGYGGTVEAAGSATCPTGTVGGQTVAGCLIVNVAGTARYVPYF